MIELNESIITATSYISEATKASQSTAALINSLIASKSSLDKFKNIFFGKRKKQSSALSVYDLINNSEEYNPITDISNISGVLAPIMGFKGEEGENYKDVSLLIKKEMNDVTIKTTENNFLSVNSREWLAYGCSLQSTVNDRVQILSLIENEEAYSIPILVSQRFFQRKLNDPDMIYGVNANLTGLKISLDNKNISALIGAEKTKNLKLAGNDSVIIPDESLINDLSVDFSFNPDIFFNKEKCFFLGYLWVIYINIDSGKIYPIYEYGNIGERSSFILLSEKLIHQIEFFKKRIWNEIKTPPENRRYRLLVSYNDELSTRITSFFQEEDYFQSREDLLFQSREEIIENLF